MSMLGIWRAACLWACLTSGFAGSDARALTGDIDPTCRARIDRHDLEALALDPLSLLNRYPDGGPRLAWRTLAIATAGPIGLRALARAIRIANVSQKIAIGEGLARAAADCDGPDSAVTTKISDLVRDGADLEVLRAFTRLLSGEAAWPTQAPPPANAKRRLGLDEVALPDR